MTVPKHCPACGEPGPRLVNGVVFCTRCNWETTVPAKDKT